LEKFNGARRKSHRGIVANKFEICAPASAVVRVANDNDVKFPGDSLRKKPPLEKSTGG